MIFGIGTDIIEVSRIREAIEKYGTRFLNRIFTDIEQKYCESFNDTKHVHYAARFACKEAFSKAIGTGITEGFKFKEIGLINLENGKPEIILENELKEKWGKYNCYVTISHTRDHAVAFVILENP